jgi:hypothetical protein
MVPTHYQYLHPFYTCEDRGIHNEWWNLSYELCGLSESKAHPPSSVLHFLLIDLFFEKLDYLYLQIFKSLKKFYIQGWRCNLMVECLPSMHKALQQNLHTESQ